MHSTSIPTAVAVASVIASNALGQTQWVKVRVNDLVGADHAYCETAIAVSSQNPSEFIAAVIHKPVSPAPANRVVYAISTNAGASAVRGTLAPASCFPTNSGERGHVDPMVAASPTSGDLWLGALYLYPYTPGFPFFSGGFSVVRRPSGTTSLDPIAAALCPIGATFENDKGWLAAGPAADNTSIESLFLAWSRKGEQNPPPLNQGYTTSPQGGPGQPPGTLWNQPERPINPDPNATNGIPGLGAAVVVIPAGQNKGRVVVAYANSTGDPNPRRWVTGTWDQTLQKIAWSLDAPLAPLVTGTVAADLPGPIKAPNFPGISIDPNDPLKIYVIFAGRSDPNTPNSDLYVVRSLDGGSTFPDVLHITDAMLGDESGVDQFMPWVAVDGYGGVNLLYYRVPTTETWPPLVQAMHARIPSFSPTSTAPLGTLALSAPFSAFVAPENPPLGSTINLGDYHMNAAKGCIVWACYVTTEGGYYNAYVRMIDVCAADVDTSGAVDGNDVLAFGTAYVAGAPAADIDRDTAIDAHDVTRFLEAYTCGCATP